MKQKIDATALDEWYEIAKSFKDYTDKVLNEVHSAKLDVMALRDELVSLIDTGQYIHDNHRIIISAPEIIIGNVNKQGILKEGGRVIIKGSDMQIHGVGDDGIVSVKAPIIEQTAVNPGIDGEEEVVCDASRIVTLARDICIDSQKPREVDFRGAVFMPSEYDSGITIKSAEDLTVMAANQNKTKKEKIDNRLESIGELINSAKEDSNAELQKMKDTIDKMKDAISQNKLLNATEDLSRANIAAVDMLSATYQDDMNTYCVALARYTQSVSKLAELQRQKACLENEKTFIPSDNLYKTNTTNANLFLMAENIGLMSYDGEGEVRTNPDAGIKMIGNNITMESIDNKGALTPAEAVGKISLRSRNINLSTEDFTGEYNQGELKSAKFPLVGNVTINSKTIDMNAVDVEMENDKYKETALTKDSSVNIRAEKVKIKTIDEQGKSVGKFSVNSQKISMKSTDIKEYKAELELDDQQNFKHPEKMNSEKVAEGSSMLLMSETMNVGFKSKEFEAKNLYASASENLLLNSKAHAQLTQGEKGSADATIDMSGKNLEVSAGGNTVLEGDGGVAIYGDTTINGKVKAGDVEVDNLDASKSVTAPNITDGMKMPGTPSKNNKNTGTEFQNAKE